MRIVLMSGAQNYEGLLRDFIAWRETGKQPPDVVLVQHGFTEDALSSVNDPKRLSTDKQGRVFVNGIQLLCLCQLMGDAPDLFDCPAVTGGDQLPSISSGDFDEDALIDVGRTEEPPMPKVAKKAVKPAKSTKPKTKKR